MNHVRNGGSSLEVKVDGLSDTSIRVKASDITSIDKFVDHKKDEKPKAKSKPETKSEQTPKRQYINYK